MEIFGINAFDLAVVGIVVFGGLIGFITGFIRGGLFVASWIGAALATWYGFGFVQPLARQYIEPGWMADLAGASAIFLVTLIALHIVSHVVSGWIRNSRLNALDRSLGLATGFVVAALIVAGAYLFFIGNKPAIERPDWVNEARTRPLVETVALFVRQLPVIKESVGKTLEQSRGRDREREKTRRALEQRPAVPKTNGADPGAGYTDSERQDMRRLLESSQ
ncbi:MAG: CvpA family protein [Alphaproteobacteria bacterium]